MTAHAWPERRVEPAQVQAALSSAPLLQAWCTALDAGGASFTIPGHKRRAGALSATLGRLLDADVPLYGGLDTPKLEHGTLPEAERIAAQAWGASWCRFTTGGSTHANQVFALAVGRPGDTVLVARTAHRSTFMGLVLAGLRPVWLPVQVDDRTGCTTGVAASTVQQAVTDHPGAVALLLVEPGYTGVVSADLPEVIALAQSAGLKVIVDQAWGAHFGFCPGYPEHALTLGADGLVLSAHKTLPAYTQASYLLARGDAFGTDWLDRCFEGSATTSPSGVVLASLDAARALLTGPVGARLLASVAAGVADARRRLRGAGFDVLGPENFPAGRFDPAKLVVRMGSTGRDGLQLECHLQRRGIALEMADRSTLVAVVGMLDSGDTLAGLVDAVLGAPAWPSRTPAVDRSAWALPTTSPAIPAMQPREAFFADRRVVALEHSVGEICAELIAPYPPGVPVLMPGERIDAVGLRTLRAAVAAGSRIAYAADPQLRTVLVVDAVA